MATKTKIDLPEIKSRFDLLYFFVQSLEKNVELKQGEINSFFGVSDELYNTELRSFIEGINYYCDVTLPNDINHLKNIVKKIKRLAK